MPYFSFSLKQIFLNDKEIHLCCKNIEINKIYFSKNTFLWKKLNKAQNKPYINFAQFEKRNKIPRIKGRVLFCLPPGIGMGDAIEYASSFRAIADKNILHYFGIAFTSRFSIIFKKYFNLKNVYKDILSKSELDKYETIFHLTLEIPQLKFQKYIRLDIEDLITKYFKVEKLRKTEKFKYKKINKISIYPVSQSPIRSMTVDLLESLISFFGKNYQIEIIYDDSSKISNYLESKLKQKSYVRLVPATIEELCNIILNTEFGIFMDSGPLHFAKNFNIKGALITTSVSGNILLNNFSTIKVIKNSFKSLYCESPCGLTNLFNWQGQIGCYESLHIKKKDLIKNENLNSMQRGSIKNEYINFMNNPVKCLRQLDHNKIVNEIVEMISK